MSVESPRFERLQSCVVPLLIDDVDTDQIIPAKYLKTTCREGLGEGLFAHWRKDPGFVLHRPELRSAQVLLAGENFGCGSSREHAPWALLDYGFRAVLSPSFADIFRLNALRNGLLPVAVEATIQRRIAAAVIEDPAAQVTIDLRAQRLTLPDGGEVAFAVDAFARRCLLDGIDQLGYLLRQAPLIEAYESAHLPAFDTRRPEAAR
ncbi:MAG: 3-isopropylmalate dehydratase small subunit [Acidobacteriota bacterium]